MIDLLPMIPTRVKIFTRVEIVTSGYTDRYIMTRTEVVLSLSCDGGMLRWESLAEAAVALATLTGLKVIEMLRLLEQAPVYYWAEWREGEHETDACTGPVRLDVMRDIASAASRQELTDAARDQVVLAVLAAPNEIMAARYQLTECNRRNQKLEAAGLRNGYPTQVKWLP